MNCFSTPLKIGRGAYGVVYVAVNGKGERVAVKVCLRI